MKKKKKMIAILLKKMFELKFKMYSFMKDDTGEYKKAKGINKTVAIRIGHEKCKDVFLNKKCMRHEWVGYKGDIIK